jgi:hypothetical protein
VFGPTCSTRNIPDAAVIQRHLDHLPLHGGQTARVCIGLQESPPAPIALLAAKPLLAITGLAILHYCLTLTVRTSHGCFRHPLHSSRAPS